MQFRSVPTPEWHSGSASEEGQDGRKPCESAWPGCGPGAGLGAALVTVEIGAHVHRLLFGVATASGLGPNPVAKPLGTCCVLRQEPPPQS